MPGVLMVAQFLSSRWIMPKYQTGHAAGALSNLHLAVGAITGGGACTKVCGSSMARPRRKKPP